jgi:hypothetical protein
VAVSAAGLVIAACGGPAPGIHQQPGHPGGPVRLNTTTIAEVMASFTDAGLAVPNAHNVTAQKCPRIGCIDAVDTDTVSIMKFPSTGSAERYAGSVQNMFLVEDVLLTFAPTVSAEAKHAYEQVTKRTVG